MPINAEDSGFLSRWSRRKELARQGVELVEAPQAATASVPRVVEVEDQQPTAPLELTAPSEPVQATTPDAEPPPTLADVALLNRDSDFRRFVGRSVQPDVRNAALAKLFRDPHFNVMDRLDVYIDDYGQPDPLPASMLRQMVQAQVLGLFDDERPQEETAPSSPSTNPIEPSAQPKLETAAPTLPLTASAAHENLDLQLQPDDGAGRAGPAAGAGQDAASAH